MESHLCSKVTVTAHDVLVLSHSNTVYVHDKANNKCTVQRCHASCIENLFYEQILYLAKFMVCSQQISDPIRPTELSQASSPDPSPWPQTYRSA